jgi:hypothetical protein
MISPHTPPLAGGGPSEQRSFFRVEQRDGVWWLIAPDGEPFFSLGVNVVDRGAAPEAYAPDRPEYVASHHYPDDPAWARASLDRLRAWGLNTLGGWCDLDTLRPSPGALPYTVGLWMGSQAGVPWLDLFAEETERTFDAAARQVVLPRKDDPLLIGYYTDNELGWWDETVFLYHLKQPPTATRRALVDLLRRHYRQDFERLKRDFDPGVARGFDDLDRSGMLTMNPGGDGREVIDAFLALLAERYYKLAHDAIRRYDPNHLILGDRYIAWHPPVVARAVGPHVDVVSTNYNADWTDGAIARFHFERLHRLTGKPILVTEFYFCAEENRSGNKNTGAGFATVKTQAERAEGYRRNLTAYARLPYVVGAHWFQYYDEPTFGRPDGEDYNMGLIDIHDRPYEELTAAASDLHRAIPSLHAAGPSDPRAEPGAATVPPAPAFPQEGLRCWDKAHGFVVSAAPFPFADLYACWDAGHLYLAVHIADYVDEELYPGGRLPEEDRPEWIITLGEVKSPIRVRFGPGGAARATGAAGEDITCRQWVHRTRYTAMAALPIALLDRAEFHPGDTIPLRAELTSHGRGDRMAWESVLTLGR